MKDPKHPLNQHLFYGQGSLWPAEATRLRIEVGHRTDQNSLLFVVSEHAMPMRKQLRLELSGAPASFEGFNSIGHRVIQELSEYSSRRLGVQLDTNPF